jgi:chromosome segregation ATPase
MVNDAAAALEAANEKIADCIAAIDALDDSNDAYIKANERLKKQIAEQQKQIAQLYILLNNRINEIAELEADKKTLINVVKNKSDFHATKDAMRIAELEAQMPKEGECKKLLRSQWINYYECSICGNRFDDAVNYCPHCGARMRGEKQC